MFLRRRKSADSVLGCLESSLIAWVRANNMTGENCLEEYD